MKPVFILAIADYRTSDQHLRELGRELDGIKEALRPAEEAGLCEVMDFADADVEKILEAFRRAGGAAVGFHFAGHANGFELLLEQSANGRELAIFLGRQKNLRFVFLNGCSTAGQAEDLHNGGVPGVISTSNAILDTVATDLAIEFYTRIASGDTLENAFESYQTRHRIENTAKKDLYQAATRDILNLAQADSAFPWNLSIKPGAEPVRIWNLPIEAGNPLFGLPSIDASHYDLPLKPYRYLHWYGREDAEVFFGRGRQIRELYLDIRNPGLRPILLVYGQSGVGKSSLLEAGLLPRLEAEYAVAYLRRKPAGLWNSLLECFDLLPDTSGTEVAEAWKIREAKEQRPLVVLLDQVEEAITRAASPQELQQFIGGIQQIFLRKDQRPKGKLILSFRKEYLSEIMRLVRGYEIPYSDFPVERLSRQGILEVVNGLQSTDRLREQYGAVMDDQLAGQVADNLLDDSTSAVAPMLQVLMSRMWDDATAADAAKPHFSLAQYQEIKRKGLALDQFLQQQLAKISEWNPAIVHSGLALDVLYFHTTPLSTGQARKQDDIVHRYGPERSPIIKVLLKQCCDLYLLVEIPAAVTPNGTASPTLFALAHDTLAPPIRRQYEESNAPGPAAARLLSSLDLSNQAVMEAKESEKYWLNAEQLRILQTGREGMRALTVPEETLLAESEAALTIRAKNARRIRRAFQILGVIVLGLSILAWFLERRNGIASKASGLRFKATYVEKTDPSAALLLIKESMSLQLDTQNQSEYYRILRENVFCDTIGREKNGVITTAAIATDGSHFAVATSSGAEALLILYEQKENGKWDATGRELVKAGNDIYQLRFAPLEKRLLAGGSGQQRLQWLDFKGNDRMPDLSGLSQIQHLALSPDSRRAAVAYLGEAGKVEIWNLKACEPEARFLLPNEAVVTALAFMPNGKTLLAGTETGEIWRFNDYGTPPVLMERRLAGPIQTIEVSSGGSYAAAAFKSDTSCVIVWKIAHDAWIKVRELPPSVAVPTVIVFSPDERTVLVAAPDDNSARLYSIANGRELHCLRANPFRLVAAGFSPSSNGLITISEDGLFRRWKLPYVLPEVSLMGVRCAAVLEKNNLIAYTNEMAGLVWATLPDLNPVSDQPITGFIPVALAAIANLEQVLAVGANGEIGTITPGSNTLNQWTESLPLAPEQLIATPDGARAVVCDAEGKGILLDIAQQKTISAFDPGHLVADLCFSTDCQLFAVAGDNNVQIFDGHSGVLKDSFSQPGILFRAIAFAHDGQTLYAGTENGQIWIRDLSEHRWSNMLQQKGRVTALVADPKGASFISADPLGHLYWWDAKDHQVFYQVRSPQTRLSVRRLVFNAAGTRLFAIPDAADGVLNIWR